MWWLRQSPWLGVMVASHVLRLRVMLRRIRVDGQYITTSVQRFRSQYQIVLRLNPCGQNLILLQAVGSDCMPTTQLGQ